MDYFHIASIILACLPDLSRNHSESIYLVSVRDKGRCESSFHYSWTSNQGSGGFDDGSSSIGEGNGSGGGYNRSGFDDGSSDSGYQRFTTDNSIETVNGVGSVVNNTSVTISIIQRVLTLNETTITSFNSGLGVTRDGILNIIAVRVLGMGIVFLNLGDGSQRSSCGDDTSAGNSKASSEESDELKK
ncbi:hypothetical protein FF38_01931 [Lucilia cuprina]|uniref:Uncharacterized protein n=1 Tax=Lucilia cuprina TaxID=7375 RepID=A0A0L0CR20_LUCCU|nr:hypothetical protein FF38_01931 [Lucilia cuprina]